MPSFPLPSSAAIRLQPLKSFSPSSSHQRHASKIPILTPRLGSNSKSHFSGRSTVSGGRGSMTELTRMAALGSDQDIEEDTALGEAEAEAMLRDGPSNLDSDLAWRNLEAILNGTSKWLVAALFGLAILWKHDAEILWAATGSVINAWLSITLKRILNHERPVAGLKPDPGMPSSHAQSIFYIEAFFILSMVNQLGIDTLTVSTGSIALLFGSYLSWLRVSQQLHTYSQILVGALLGSCCGVAWYWLWHSFVLEAFISLLWVRILVVLGSVTFCGAFVVYVIQHWLRDEP
ncbi:hypothetical protein BHE74_00002204 [Ensete ventricosum]|nr:hypothetical protein BHE74_00002204 [Ensete ventricosum]